jgi:hypothetical protein
MPPTGHPQTGGISSFNRRDLLRTIGVVAFAGAAATTAGSEPAQAATPSGGTVPGFLHGVASGDPLPSSVLLWTRITPTQDSQPGSGVGPDVTTGSVLSKRYLFGIFGERATYRWEPYPLLPVTGHAPDVATMDALIAMVDGVDPDFVFTNLGDVDRVGHSDVTGTTVQAARTLALKDTDDQVGRFVDHLVAAGTWESSVLIVLADHSMDWSIPSNVISVDQILSARPDLRAQIAIAQNGGADLLYWTGQAAARDAGLAEVRTLVAAHPGVLSIAHPAELRLGVEAGDLVAYCRAGWRFSDPYVTSNPIPGNHGHPATEPIPFFVAGGSPRVATGVSSRPARTIDVAPTVGGLFGITAPAGGYDGTARTEAFTG